MSSRFGFVPVLPPFAGAGQDESVVAGYVERLEALGGTRVSAEELADPVPLLLLIATGGTEGAALALRERRLTVMPGEPALIVAHPGNNSLPAALELLARVRQDGGHGRILYVRGLDDERGWEEIEAAVRDAEVRARMHAMRLGVVGDPSDWLVASAPELSAVTRTWGPEVVPIPMAELTALLDDVDPAEAAEAADSLREGAAGCVEPDEAARLEAARVYVALRRLVGERGLDAVTVRCFDIVLQRDTSGCFALSRLTDEGIVAGCEGDLMSTVGMVWAKVMTGEVPWMANPADIEETADALWLAHCTVPRSIVEGYTLRSHFESGRGVGLAGVFPKGPVTLLRIGGLDTTELWLAEGELTDVGTADNLCRTQARIALTLGRVRDLLTSPLGNHLVMVRGRHAIRLKAWHETML